MKKVLIFDYESDFVLKNIDGECLLKIDKVELKLDAKDLYIKLFKDLTDYPEYEIENKYNDVEDKQLNKKARLIYNVIKEIISEICNEIKAKNLFNMSDILEKANG